MIIEIVRGLSNFYADGQERIEIWVQKNKSWGLPFVEGSRIPITLVLKGKKYEAGLRSTKNMEYAWICPNLINEYGHPVKLAHVLSDNGFQKLSGLALMLMAVQ